MKYAELSGRNICERAGSGPDLAKSIFSASNFCEGRREKKLGGGRRKTKKNVCKSCFLAKKLAGSFPPPLFILIGFIWTWIAPLWTFLSLLKIFLLFLDSPTSFTYLRKTFRALLFFLHRAGVFLFSFFNFCYSFNWLWPILRTSVWFIRFHFLRYSRSLVFYIHV